MQSRTRRSEYDAKVNRLDKEQTLARRKVLPRVEICGIIEPLSLRFDPVSRWSLARPQDDHDAELTIECYQNESNANPCRLGLHVHLLVPSLMIM
jgi:hypothetical protein